MKHDLDETVTPIPHLILLGLVEKNLEALPLEGYAVTLIERAASIRDFKPETVGKFANIVPIDFPGDPDSEWYAATADLFLAGAQGAAEKMGRPVAILSFWESTIQIAGSIREHFGLQGMTSATAHRYRDKIEMKKILRTAGIEIPDFFEIKPGSTTEEVKSMASKFGKGIVLKPAQGVASNGVRIFDDSDEFATFLQSAGSLDGYEAEEVVEGRLCHFDGIMRNREIVFFCASRYVGTPYDFVHKRTAMGSVVLDEPGIVERALKFTEDVIDALGPIDGAFHLEAFLTQSRDLVFLEIAARPGGAEIVEQFRSEYGVDLIDESFRAELGLPTRVSGLPIAGLDGLPITGWLYLAPPERVRLTVTEVSGFTPLPATVVQARIPEVGQLLDASSGPFASSASFILRGNSSKLLVKDMEKLMAAQVIVAKNSV